MPSLLGNFGSFQEDENCQPGWPVSQAVSSPFVYVTEKCIICICHTEAHLSTSFLEHSQSLPFAFWNKSTREPKSFLILFVKLTTSVCIPAFNTIIKQLKMYELSINSYITPHLALVIQRSTYVIFSWHFLALVWFSYPYNTFSKVYNNVFLKRIWHEV